MTKSSSPGSSPAVEHECANIRQSTVHYKNMANPFHPSNSFIMHTVALCATVDMPDGPVISYAVQFPMDWPHHSSSKNLLAIWPNSGTSNRSSISASRYARMVKNAIRPRSHRKKSQPKKVDHEKMRCIMKIAVKIRADCHA